MLTSVASSLKELDMAKNILRQFPTFDDDENHLEIQTRIKKLYGSE
jgi:hypothetical protein